MRPIAGAIDLLERISVDPFVGDDSIAIGIASGQHSGVAGRRECHCVPVVSIGEPCAILKQQPKTAWPVYIAILYKLFRRQAVNDDDDNQRRGIACCPSDMVISG